MLLVVPAMAGCVATGGTGPNSVWAYDITEINDVKELGRTGKGIRVGVLDTGVDVTHFALQHLVDGDRNNGELVAFEDFVGGPSGKEVANDPHGHGTHVIGIMSAQGSPISDKILYGGVNPIGGSPHIQLWVARVCQQAEDGRDGETNCPSDAISDALAWMGDQQLDIVTMSLGGRHLQGIVFEDSMITAVNELIDDGVVVVAAAGNEGASADDVSSPADIPGVIAVGAINEDGRVATLSSRGDQTRCVQYADIVVPGQRPQCVQESEREAPHQKPEVVAPGVDISSTWTNGIYARADGTSQAAPFVTSAIALALEAQPEFRTRADVENLKRALMDSARPVDGQFRPHDDGAGYGIIQAKALIEALD